MLSSEQTVGAFISWHETRDGNIRNDWPAVNRFLTQRRISYSWSSFHFKVTQTFLPQAKYPSALVDIHPSQTRVKGLLKCITTCKSTCITPPLLACQKPKTAEIDYKGEIKKLSFPSRSCIQSRVGNWTQLSREGHLNLNYWDIFPQFFC